MIIDRSEEFKVTVLFRCLFSLPMGEGWGEAVMGMGSGTCWLNLLVQSYKIIQRLPNNRAKKSEKSDESGFRRGHNALTIKQIHAFVKG